MSTFEDHLWSQLVSDHGEQMRQAKKETAILAASLRESSGRRRWRASGRRSSRRQLVLAASTLGVACLASAIIVAHSATKNPSAPPTSPAAFAVANNHDGTLTLTLHKRSALPALNASLVSYGLKAKLPRGVSARTLSLTATCPKPTFPVKAAPGSGQNQVIHPAAVAVPSQSQSLKNCLLHAATS